MEDAAYNYWFIWTIYLVASAIFFRVFWKITAFKRRLWLSYSMRALLVALVLTPWYANIQGSSLAPALMIMTLDAITLSPTEASRALVPLLLALLLAEILATVMWIARIRRKSH